MATVTPGYTFQNNEIVTPAKINSAATPVISNIGDSDISPTAAIAFSKLAAVVQQALIPSGAVQAFAMNSAPSGWLAANGSTVSRTTYSALFAAIGTTYGTGDGNTTFHLPDLRGYFVRGSGTNTDGTASGTFGAKQADGVISHTHSGTTGNDSPDHTHAFSQYSPNNGNFREAGGNGPGLNNSRYTDATGGASTRHQHLFTTSSQSPAGNTETRPRNIAMLYCIKA